MSAKASTNVDRLGLHRLATVACFGALALGLTACGTFSGTARVDSALNVGPPRTIEAAVVGDADPASAPSAAPEREATLVATAADPATDAAPQSADAVADPLAPEEGMAQARETTTDVELEAYDPWEGWNTKAFDFNRRLDKYVLKPFAKGYNFVVPDEIQIMIANGFGNISFVPRFINNLLQGNVKGAGREIGRFLINSTAGVGGLFDPAKDVFGILKSRKDFGQTLCVYGVRPGRYVIVPFLEPLTIREGIGKAVDSLMEPLSYFLPLVWDRVGMKVGDIVNERSLNLDLFQGFEESTVDMYSAVRHAYLQRRERFCQE